MPADLVTVVFPDSDPEALRIAYEDHVVACIEENLDELPYSGTLASCDGLLFHDDPVATDEQARALIDERTEKWGPALAVRVDGPGGRRWIVGGQAAT